MKSKTHRPLELEKLEDRWVPATVRFDGSNLYVSNPLITAGKSTLSVIQTSATTFQVKDGAANNGSYAVSGNINVQGNNAKATVTVNVLAGSGLSGNLSVNAGNGSNSVTVDSTAATGFIAGNTSIALGNGTNTVGFGSAVGLTEKGSLSVSSRGAGASTLKVLGGGAGAAVLGSTTIGDFPNVNLGLGSGVFAGSVSINNTANSQSSFVNGAFSHILGNFTVQGGPGPTFVIVGSVLGTAALNLGNGLNGVGFEGVPCTIGNFIYNGGNGTNGIDVDGGATVLGNAVLNWGNGANTFASGGSGTAGLTVDGNMSITNGNGSLNAAGAPPFQAVVNGNLTVNTGNGSNKFTLDVTGGANVGGTFSYTGGNGGNSVTVNNTTANTTAMNVRFGNGSANLMTLNAGAPGTGNLTGSIGWGVPTSFLAGVNGFVDNGYVWQNNVTLTNIPS